MSALTKASEEKKTQATNDYCQTCATEEKRAETCDGDTVAAEKELLKPSDAEWPPLYLYFYPYIQQLA